MKLIVACDPSGGIGYQNKLPWSKIQGDLPRFKHLTQNKIIVMGRNTWDSLPKKPLPDRTNTVVTSSPLSLEGVIVIHDIYDLTDDHWLIGGAQLIKSCWNQIKEVHLTTTHDHYTCDTYIDLLYLENNFDIIYGEIFSDHTYQIWKRK